MKKLLFILLTVSFLHLPRWGIHLAQAWDGTVGGTINSLESTGAHNYPFRVTLAGTPALCGNANTWAYLSDSDGNYKVNVALLMSAKAQSRTVILYADQDGSGYCQIGYITMQ